MPHAQGVAKIILNDGGGAYKITQLWWNPNADPVATYDEAVAPAGVVNKTARDYRNRAQGGVGQKVAFWTQRRKGGRTEFLIDVTRERFPAKLTYRWLTNGSYSSDWKNNPPTQWTYEFKEVGKTVTGYSPMFGSPYPSRTWTETGGRTGIAHNRIEDINTRITHALGKTEQMGNGAVLENLDYDSDDTYEFMPEPVPAYIKAAIVEIEVVNFKIDDTEYEEYWFSYENGTDGGCA